MGLKRGAGGLLRKGGSLTKCCCGEDQCNCKYGFLPSSWTLYFYNCTYQFTNLEGMTFEVPRGVKLDGSPNTCSGYIFGDPYLCTFPDGGVYAIGIDMGNSGYVFAITVFAYSTYSPPFPLPGWAGNYGGGAWLAGEGEEFDRWDCRNQSGTIHAASGFGSVLPWGFDCDITPHA